MRLTTTALLTSTLLAGCGTFAGSHSKTPVVKDGEVVTNIIGMPVYTTVRKSKTVTMIEQGVEYAKDVTEKNNGISTNKCATYSFEQINQLKSGQAQAAYMENLKQCQFVVAISSIVSTALNRPVSEADAVMRSVAKAAIGIEKEATAKVKAIANPLAVTIGVKSIASSFEAVGKAKGNTTVGNISASDSGDSVGGEGVNSTTTSSSNIIIGDGNSTNTAFDEATAGGNVLTPDNSSSGSLVVDGKTQGQQTAEEINAAAPTNDEDGLKF